MGALPETDEEQVAALRFEYEELSRKGQASATEACFRYAVLTFLLRRKSLQYALETSVSYSL